MNRKQVKTRNGVVEPIVLWGYAYTLELRKKAMMPQDFQDDVHAIEELEGEIWNVLKARAKVSPDGGTIDCTCGRGVPDYPEFQCCPFCGARFEPVDSVVENDSQTDPDTDEETEEPQALALCDDADLHVRLEDTEEEIAFHTTQTIRSYWEIGRLLARVRDEELYTTVGLKSFSAYLDTRSICRSSAYNYIAFFSACSGEHIDACEGLTHKVIFRLAHSANDLNESELPIHEIFQTFVGELNERQIEGPASLEDANDVIDAVIESSSSTVIDVPPNPGPVQDVAGELFEEGETEPESDESQKEDTTLASAPSPVNNPRKKRTSIPEVEVDRDDSEELVRVGITHMRRRGELAYHTGRGKKLARTRGTLLGKCIHIPGLDGKYLRIVLGHNACLYSVEEDNND